ncbi:MAG: succinylglutamate desuccinylase/aspartoacylase family protein [Candidatus Competibacteraceae bacterium]|nr:succinylglutamate desuccinylase/aspartoacylase family protein [Candidatus Competibacteraceae bacterium]
MAQTAEGITTDLAEVSKISTEVDFERNGKQISFLKAPHSTNTSGWGSLLIPITVIKNGQGPTMLLTAGNHGDEYEGQVALTKLARELQPQQIRGRVIIMPALNYPAVMAGTRLSPLDGRNMNRVFPGDRYGTITLMIAHYVSTRLLPLADIVVDIHSGGGSMIFASCAVMHHLDDARQMATTLEAVKQFGTPIALVLRELDNVGMLDTVVEEMGKVFISTELGGGAFLSPQSVAFADVGVRNLLKHFEILEGTPERPEDRGLPPTRLMEVPEEGGFAMAMIDGLYEPLVEVGEEVQAETPLGRIHRLEEPSAEPLTVSAGCSGVLITRAGRGQVRRGDTVVVMATDLPAPGGQEAGRP